MTLSDIVVVALALVAVRCLLRGVFSSGSGDNRDMAEKPRMGDPCERLRDLWGFRDRSDND